MSIAILPESMALVNAGLLRSLAITTLERSPQFPDFPTVSESLPGFELISWYGFVVREGTPKEIVSILNTAFDAALHEPDLNNRLTEMGFNIVGGKPEKLRELMISESDKWGQIVVEANISLN